jgi:hypothetical protein
MRTVVSSAQQFFSVEFEREWTGVEVVISLIHAVATKLVVEIFHYMPLYVL